MKLIQVVRRRSYARIRDTKRIGYEIYVFNIRHQIPDDPALVGAYSIPDVWRLRAELIQSLFRTEIPVNCKQQIHEKLSEIFRELQ